MEKKEEVPACDLKRKRKERIFDSLLKLKSAKWLKSDIYFQMVRRALCCCFICHLYRTFDMILQAGAMWMNAIEVLIWVFMHTLSILNE